MARTVYRVLPNGTQWDVKREGTLLRTFAKKDEAVSYGQTEAKGNPPSQLVIHRADGTIEKEWTYGDDPYPPPG